MLTRNGVLLKRCAWHRYYRGYPVVYGVARWRGAGLSFTDGVCGRCSGRLRRDLELPPARWPSLPTGRIGVEPLAVPPGGVALIVLAILLSLARPLDAPPPPLVTAALPVAARPAVTPPAATSVVGRLVGEPPVAARRMVERRVAERRPVAAVRREPERVRPAARVEVVRTPRVDGPRVRGADFQSP